MSSRRGRGSCGALAIAACLAGGAETAAQTRQNPPLVIASMSGRDLFQFYCATCHGRDARGQGPVAPALKTPPADLTAIARRNGAQFPRARIIAFVTAGGEAPVSSHGSREMPVWGPIFQGLDNSDAKARVRIENVVSYIESLQEH